MKNWDWQHTITMIGAMAGTTVLTVTHHLTGIEGLYALGVLTGLRLIR